MANRREESNASHNEADKTVKFADLSEAMVWSGKSVPK